MVNDNIVFVEYKASWLRGDASCYADARQKHYAADLIASLEVEHGDGG